MVMPLEGHRGAGASTYFGPNSRAFSKKATKKKGREILPGEREEGHTELWLQIT